MNRFATCAANRLAVVGAGLLARTPLFSTAAASAVATPRLALARSALWAAR